MQLSPNFHLDEFTKSQTAQRKGIDNTPNSLQIANLAWLCTNVLEPLRQTFGPVHINSGFRCTQLNRAVGGAPSSQHVKGEAADIEVPGVPNHVIAEFIKTNLPHDQVILEYYTPGHPASGWVHVSLKNGQRNRRQALTITPKGTLNGIHP